MQDCLNPTQLSCRYYTQFDHATEDCPILLAKIHEKGAKPHQLTQNLQMMRVEPHDEDSNVNIVLRSRIAMGDDKGKRPEDIAWVCKDPEKKVEFDLERARETFMEEKKSFTEASTSGSKDKRD